MKKNIVFFVSLLLILALLTGCSMSKSATEGNGEASGDKQMKKESAKGNKFDIHFVYRNDFYGYNLEANWADVLIKKTNTNTATQNKGLELLLDGSLELFGELDLDHSGTISQSEWAEIEPDFPFEKQVLNSSGEMEYDGFRIFALELGGIDLDPTGFTITQPTLENYALELNDENAPVSIKILRASTTGFTGGYNKYFPADTVFIELSSDFEIFLETMPGLSATSAFDYPLLNMYLDDTKEVKDSYSHGALGFSSIVDTEKFNALFNGKPFSLHYDAYYEGKVVGTYDLTISPKH
ncbi:MAG: hypothetical protein ACOX4U_05130 [Anaerovoracaceae bacterium]|jgi:hypothetical protein